MARQFEYEQQLSHLKMPLDDIKRMLSSKPIDYAGIVHDKDDAEPHLHVMGKLHNSSMQPKDIAKWFNDEPQYINIKRSRWENKLAYLCHRTDNARDKFQYNPVEVFANFDYIKVLENISVEVEQKKNIESILTEISEGKIREYNLSGYVDVITYTKNRSRILAALEWYRWKIMTDKDRNIKVVMISGDTGVGKTTYAKQYCKNLGKSFCISSSSNDPMQDYKGEDVLIMDDIRDDAFKFHDFLKLLDNHTKSTTASRYSNKAFIGDTIILTSSKNIDNWYPNINEHDIKQLHRRITLLFEMTEQTIKISEFNNNDMEYHVLATTPNILKLTQKKVKEDNMKIIEGFGIELSHEVKEHYMNYNKASDDKTMLDMINDEDLPF